MTPRLLLVLATAVLAASGSVAQTEQQAHLLVIEDSQVFLDGRLLPNAVPADLDLSGLGITLEYSGPVTPVVEVDGQAYVLENGRLTRFEQSSRAGQGVYILGELTAPGAPPAQAQAMPEDQMALVSEQAYLRGVAERDEALYRKLQQERDLEGEVEALGETVRRTPRGATYTDLRAHLRSRLSDLFRLKMEVRRQEVARAQAQLDEMRELLDLRDARHEAIVDARLREMIGE
jgi:hypothetical protein